jgi:hypothetical protein
MTMMLLMDAGSGAIHPKHVGATERLPTRGGGEVAPHSLYTTANHTPLLVAPHSLYTTLLVSSFTSLPHTRTMTIVRCCTARYPASCARFNAVFLLSSQAKLASARRALAASTAELNRLTQENSELSAAKDIATSRRDAIIAKVRHRRRSLPAAPPHGLAHTHTLTLTRTHSLAHPLAHLLPLILLLRPVSVSPVPAVSVYLRAARRGASSPPAHHGGHDVILRDAPTPRERLPQRAACRHGVGPCARVSYAAQSRTRRVAERCSS